MRERRKRSKREHNDKKKKPNNYKIRFSNNMRFNTCPYLVGLRFRFPQSSSLLSTVIRGSVIIISRSIINVSIIIIITISKQASQAIFPPRSVSAQPHAKTRSRQVYLSLVSNVYFTRSILCGLSVSASVEQDTRPKQVQNSLLLSLLSCCL